MTGHKATVTSLAFHPQYTQLATSSEDGSMSPGTPSVQFYIPENKREETK